MITTSVALAVLAVLLAWPIPIVLARAAWTRRSPGSALVAWQAIALAGGLSMIGALLTFGLAPFGSSPPEAARAFLGALIEGTAPSRARFDQLFAISGAVLLAAHLVLSLAVTWLRMRRSARRHIALIGLLTRTDPERPATRVLEVDAPVAYCLPGLSRSVTVLSDGLVSLLGEPELGAVVAHEEGHALQRHHLVQVSFRAWRRALPWFPIATRAEAAVSTLIELLADDHARHRVDDAVLRRSILRVATEAERHTAVSGAFDRLPGHSTGGLAALRADRLAPGSPGRLPVWGRAGVLIGAGALVALPVLWLVSPTFG